MKGHGIFQSTVRLLAIGLSFYCASVAYGSTLIFERALPDSTDVNDAAGPNRSNISFINQVSGGVLFVVGDDVDLSMSLVPNVNGQWLIDSISVFEVANTAITASDAATGLPSAASAPQNEFSSLTLLVGDAFDDIQAVSSTFTSKFVQYEPAGLNYQGSTGAFFPIYQITFSDLNVVVNANADIGFAVNAVPNGANTWAIDASNAALSGTLQNGADNMFLLYCTDSMNSSTATSATFCASVDSNGNGFDKSSDVNVLITASDVPEPPTLSVVGLTLVAAFVVRRGRRKRGSDSTISLSGRTFVSSRSSVAGREIGPTRT